LPAAANQHHLVGHRLVRHGGPLAVSSGSGYAYLTSLVQQSQVADGSEIPGSEPVPVVRGGHAFWPQPLATNTPVQRIAQMRDVDLSTSESRVIATGVISSPIIASTYVMWASHTGADGDASGFALNAIDPSTGRPVALPDAVAHPGEVGSLAGSPDAVVWTTKALDTAVVHSMSTGEETAMVHSAAGDGNHQLQFLQLAGNYLLWASPVGFVVADLRTGVSRGLPEYASAALAGGELFVSQPQAVPTSKVERYTSVLGRLSWVQLGLGGACT
jgi:hypothetical protein